MKKLFTLIMVILITVSVFAQAPQKMSYQCVVRNSSGVLITNQSVGIRISILQGTSTGTIVYQETYNPNPQTNANGLVNMEIGNGIAFIGTFASIDWTSGAYFLKTETDPTGGTNYSISGTTQLLSVPYAIYANTAGNGFSGSYNDLINRPILFSGNYNDLINRPVLFDGTWDNITNKPTSLSAYGITDGMSTSHIAYGITSSMIENWTNAFGWGSHIGLYRPIGYVPAWIEITSKPTSVDGYGISDALTITGNQTITGIKTFSNDLSVNGLTIGKGNIGDPSINSGANDNTAIGYQGLYSNTLGGFNTAVGSRSLWSNTIGYENTSIGYQGLYSNTSGNSNTAVGSRSLWSNTSGNSNTAIGVAALTNNTTGSQNTATGMGSLIQNKEGNSNTAYGVGSLLSNTASLNTAIGVYSLYSNNIGESNIAIGVGALYRNTSGNYNTATGNNALAYNENGSFNTAYGEGALSQNEYGSGNTAIGYQALHTVFFLYPHIKSGNYNTAVGYQALYSNITGYGNTAIGDSAGFVNGTGSYNTVLGINANMGANNLTNSTAIGSSAVVNASNKVRIGNANVTVIEGQVNWSVGSDIRLKEDIEYSDKLGLEFLSNLKTVTFTYKNDPAKKQKDGLIAQDVEETLNQLGLTFSGIVESENEEKTLNLSYAEFVIPLINSVKELNNKNQKQQKQIEELNAIVNSLIANQKVQVDK